MKENKEYSSWEDLLKFLKVHNHQKMLIDGTAVENNNCAIDLIFQFLNLGDFTRHFFKIKGNSLAPKCDISSWIKREIQEMFPVKFQDHGQEKLLVPSNLQGYPLSKKFIGKLIDYNPVIDKKLYTYSQDGIEFDCRLAGDKVTELNARPGFYFSGQEKLWEEKKFENILSLMEHFQNFPQGNYAICWAMTVEKLLKIEVPLRGQVMRMIILELSRVASHFHCLLRWNDLNSQISHLMRIPFQLCIDLMSTFFPSSLSALSIGGPKEDIESNWSTKYGSLILEIENYCNRIDQYLTRSRVWQDYCNSVKVDGETAIKYSYTGPNLRASGIRLDLRKNFPYLSYPQVKFEIPLGIRGTSFDRYLVRIEEIRQSLGIIRQLVSNLPGGDYSLNLSSKDLGNLIKNTSGCAYNAIESPQGELGIFLDHREGEFPYRVKMRAPSFFHFESIEKISIGKNLGDVIHFFKSLDINPLEVDR